jgi:predicted nucleotidyltransferase
MDRKSVKALKEFAELVRARFPSARIRAFGSRARGGATQQSDLDVCIIVDRMDEIVDQQIRDMAWRVGFENGLVISTVPYSREEFETGPCSASPLVRTILREGVAV